MADCVAITDRDGLPDAGSYFNSFPTEATLAGDVTIAKVIELPSITMITLLTAIARESDLKTLVLACHANPAGLLIGLKVSSWTNTLNMDAMNVLLSATGDAASEAKNAERLNLSVQDLTTLRKLSTAMRRMGIARVIIRGCKIGANTEVLGKLRAFFGCGYICAPSVTAYFGKLNVPIATDATDWANWEDHHPIALGDDDVRYDITKENPLEIDLDPKARSREALIRWAKKHFGSFRGPSFPYELLRAPDKLVFPKEPDFLKYLARLSG